MIDWDVFKLLRKQRADAIARCEFPKAKLLDLRLKHLTAQLEGSGATSP
jgi:hypothetical protein